VKRECIEKNSGGNMNILRVLRSIWFAGFMVLFIGVGSNKNLFSQEQGLLLHYDFSEGTGNILKDKSGNGNDGIIHGAKWIKEEDGYSLSFNGIDNYVEVKDSPSLKIENEFTIEILVKPGENPKKQGIGDYRLIIGKGGELWDSHASFALYVNQGRKNFVGYVRYGPEKTIKKNEVYTVRGLVKKEHWQNVVLVKEKGTLKLSADSVPSSTPVDTPEKMIFSARPLKIGGVHTRFFEGYIKEIKIFNYAKEKKVFSSSKPGKERKAPYLVMVSSLDERISSTPLLDVKNETIELLNGSPFDGIAFNLVDIYSGQPLPDERMVIQRAEELKSISMKEIWVRVNMNRMYQRSKGSVYSVDYDENPKIFAKDLEALSKLPYRGLAYGEVRKQSAPYFAKIKGVDIYDKEGALSDFYKIWRLSLKFCKVMGSGILFDLETYGYSSGYDVTAVAESQGKSIEEVIKRFQKIGADLVDMVGEEYPEITIISCFTYLNRPNHTVKGGGSYYAFPAYVTQGMLMRAKEKKIPLKIVEGGEGELNYVNRTLKGLQSKVSRRWFWYFPLMERFPNFRLGGTITLWDDSSKISGWPKTGAGEPNPFQSLNDFKPLLKELFSNYDYTWIYQPMSIDYKPYDPNIAPGFHQKLRKVIDEVLSEIKEEQE